MQPIAFYVVAALILVAALGATFLRDTKQAAIALLGTLVGLALLFAVLRDGLLAAVQFVVLAGGAAGLFHLAYWRTAEAGAQPPSEERRYWAGLVSVLAFVLFFRVIAGSEWGTQDVSELVSNPAGALPWLAIAAFVLVGVVAALAIVRKEEA